MAKSGGREVWRALSLLHLPSLLLSVHSDGPLPLCSVLQLQIGRDRRAVSSAPLSQIEASNSTCASGGGHSGWNRRTAGERNPQLALQRHFLLAQSASAHASAGYTGHNFIPSFYYCFNCRKSRDHNTSSIPYTSHTIDIWYTSKVFCKFVSPKDFKRNPTKRSSISVCHILRLESALITVYITVLLNSQF